MFAGSYENEAATIELFLLVCDDTTRWFINFDWILTKPTTDF